MKNKDILIFVVLFLLNTFTYSQQSFQADDKSTHAKLSVFAGYGYETASNSQRNRSNGREIGEVIYQKPVQQVYVRFLLETRKHRQWQLVFTGDHRLAKGMSGTYSLGGSISASGNFSAYYFQTTLLHIFDFTNPEYLYFAPGLSYGQMYKLQGTATEYQASMSPSYNSTSVPIENEISSASLGLYAEIGGYIPITRHLQVHIAHALQLKTSQGFYSGPNTTLTHYVGVRFK
jgi:hypothetical protein